MGEVANYFARERYIKTRLSLLVLAGFALLVPAVLASARGRFPAYALAWAYGVFVVCVAFAVVSIVRTARAKFPKSRDAGDEHLDPSTRGKLRRRILFLQCAAAFYALVAGFGLWHAHSGTWLKVIIATALYLLLEVVIYKAIHRLKIKLRQSTSVASAASPQ